MFTTPVVKITFVSEKITVKLSPYEKLKEDIIHGRRPIHGVNLGGWLTVEYFLTKNSPVWTGVPEDIAYQGEYKTMAYLGILFGCL